MCGARASASRCARERGARRSVPEPLRVGPRLRCPPWPRRSSASPPDACLGGTPCSSPVDVSAARWRPSYLLRRPPLFPHRGHPYRPVTTAEWLGGAAAITRCSGAPSCPSRSTLFLWNGGASLHWAAVALRWQLIRSSCFPPCSQCGAVSKLRARLLCPHTEVWLSMG